MKKTIIKGIEDEDLAYKIDNEGGIDGFFLGYISFESIQDKELAKYVKSFSEVSKKIEKRLRDLGIPEL